MKNFTIIEEFNIKKSLQEPHLSYIEGTLPKRLGVAHSIVKRNEYDVLLIASSGFLIDSVFAGLTEKHIEYIAKNGPINYKESLLNILQSKEMMNGVLEIVNFMDEYFGKNITKNQDRIHNVIQYIKDNRVVFEF